MINIEKTFTYGWEAAIRGMRNPYESWDRSDSIFSITDRESCRLIGSNDLELMMKLVHSGSDHCKYLRMITVTCDITAPLYWWKEYDTYKVGTVADSCSTMHCIAKKEFTLDDFSHEHLRLAAKKVLDKVIDALNAERSGYNDPDATSEMRKECFNNMVQLLPSSYNQKRTVQLNYQVLRNMYKARKNHKLSEWRSFCSWVETLPHSELITEAWC